MVTMKVIRTLAETSTRYVLADPLPVTDYRTKKVRFADVLRVAVNDDDTVEVAVHPVAEPAGSWIFVSDEDEIKILEHLGIETDDPPGDGEFREFREIRRTDEGK